MSLKAAVYKELSSKLFDYLYNEHTSRILVLDEYTTKVISKIFKMHDIYDKGITLVDDLNKRREPVPLEAIYLMIPRPDKIQMLLNDFQSTPTYIGAHVFFIDECSMENLEIIGKSVAANYILTLREIQINFLINESQLFSFDLKLNVDGFAKDIGSLELARGLAGICDILNENPEIYCQNNEKSQRFASQVFNELNKKSLENPSLGQSAHKDKSVLLILDRSIDPLTPLLHDLHLQCLAYDLLQIDNDIYSYKNQDTGKECHVDLTDDDILWAELRHLHIADVSRILPSKLDQLSAARRCIDASANPFEASGDSKDVSDMKRETLPNKEYVNKQLAYMVKKLPHLRQEAASVSNLFHLSEACLRAFKNGVSNLCDAEQSIVMGTDSKGNKIKSTERLVYEVLTESNATMSEKIRLLFILILSQAVMTESKILEMVEKLGIESSFKQMYYELDRIHNCVCYTSSLPPKVQWTNYPYLNINRKHVVDASTYTLSRWTPFIKDIMEDIICGQIKTNVISKFNQRTLSLNHLTIQPDGIMMPQRLSWAKSMDHDVHSGPRLIVFILDGVTLAESRVASDITKLCQSLKSGQFKKTTNILSEHGGGRSWHWEVVIGGTEILVPETYLNNLKRDE